MPLATASISWSVKLSHGATHTHTQTLLPNLIPSFGEWERKLVPASTATKVNEDQTPRGMAPSTAAAAAATFSRSGIWKREEGNGWMASVTKYEFATIHHNARSRRLEPFQLGIINQNSAISRGASAGAWCCAAVDTLQFGHLQALSTISCSKQSPLDTAAMQYAHHRCNAQNYHSRTQALCVLFLLARNKKRPQWKRGKKCGPHHHA